jgi:thiol:disulfide interchange protein
MKKLLSFFLLFITLAVQGQILHPGKWTFTVDQKKAGEAELVFSLKLEKHWHTYPPSNPDGGSLPMVFEFEKGDCYSLAGKMAEPKPIIEFDSIFGVYQHYINGGEGDIVFRQKIKLNSGSCKISGRIDFQVCQESCIPEDTTFSFTVGKQNDAVAPVVELPVDTLLKQSIDTTPQATISQTDTTGDTLEEGCGTAETTEGTHRGYLGIFIAGMLGGLLALLTPCVFPMIPMTVSFFTKRSGSRKKGITNAIIYALSIIFIYVSLGILVTVTFGSDALNEAASNAFFNLAFFVIFVIFAISFFGAFEITLPSWIINKADSASDRGGLIGIFFMAFTLSLVSFSCTGPIIGTLLVEAAQGQSYLGPILGMTGFALALAIPFALFSLFPGWMNSLPKSGSWLNTVKVTLGFIELALAMKFLSNVDLAYHWGFLKREIFICIWVIISALLGFYMLGKIRFEHDNEVQYIGTGRLLMGILVFTFTIYLIPGIWGAPLKLISGFPPPEFYKEWTTGTENECPHDINCFHDYDEGMRYARAQGKPVMLDFTGWSCVNCRKMEDKVWSEKKVLKHLLNDYVLISLYVDDKVVLPAEQQYTSPSSGKKIKTTGNKWSDFQQSVYKTNTQPYYVLIDNKAKLLAKPRGGIIPVDEYASYLEEGICRYKLRK